MSFQYVYIIYEARFETCEVKFCLVSPVESFIASLRRCCVVAPACLLLCHQECSNADVTCLFVLVSNECHHANVSQPIETSETDSMHRTVSAGDLGSTEWVYVIKTISEHRRNGLFECIKNI